MSYLEKGQNYLSALKAILPPPMQMPPPDIVLQLNDLIELGKIVEAQRIILAWLKTQEPADG